MEFDTIEEAWQFWKAYGKKTGFGVRKRFTNRANGGPVTSARYCCSKEGVREINIKQGGLVRKPKAETRTNCPVMLGVLLDRNSCKYVVHTFESNHCHEVHDADLSHMIRSHREVTDVQAQAIMLAHDAGLTQKQQYDLSTVLAGGREKVGHTRADAKNFLSESRKRLMELGDARFLVQYFETRAIVDTDFVQFMQCDDNDQITNIFWVDGRMKIDYDLFGDVLTFDTTFGTNSELRPLGLFLGFNHHRQLVIFGAALL